MACKMVIFARRRSDLTHEECIEYMETEHAPLVQELPGLRKYTSSVPVDPDDAGYDEMAQLWFDSPADMNAAFESDAGRAVQEDAANFTDPDSTLMIPVTDETVHLDARE